MGATRGLTFERDRFDYEDGFNEVVRGVLVRLGLEPEQASAVLDAADAATDARDRTGDEGFHTPLEEEVSSRLAEAGFEVTWDGVDPNADQPDDQDDDQDDDLVDCDHSGETGRFCGKCGDRL